MLCLAPSVVTAGTNIIQNGSFEFAANQALNLSNKQNHELGQALECNSVTSRGVTNWLGSSGRTWYMNATTNSTFPDGDWCVRIDAAINNGVDVLAQSGLYLKAGRKYELTFSMWGEVNPTSGLDVRFTYGYTDMLVETNGTGVTVIDEKTTDGTDNVAETLTVPFNPTVTADYAVQFFLDPPYGTGHVWVDNVVLIQLVSSTAIMIQ